MLAELLAERVGGKPKGEIEELILDGWLCSELTLSDKSLLEEFTELEFLSMNNCGLTSLRNFPALPQLLKLDLNGNKIVAGLGQLEILQNLMQLGLADNGIKDVGEVDALERMPALLILDTTNCPVSAEAGYREHVFSKLDNLNVLNGADEDGKEISEGEYDSELDAEDLGSDIDSECDSSDSGVPIPVRRYRPGAQDTDSDSSDSDLAAKRRK